MFDYYNPQNTFLPQRQNFQMPQMMQQPTQRPMYGVQQAKPVFVNGRAGADAYAMGPNDKAVLFAENEPVFFFKATDGAGYPTTKTYRYDQEPEPGASPAVAYVTQEEAESLRAEISELKGMINNVKQHLFQRQPDPEEWRPGTGGGYDYEHDPWTEPAGAIKEPLFKRSADS